PQLESGQDRKQSRGQATAPGLRSRSSSSAPRPAHASVVRRGCCPSGYVGRRGKASIPTSVLAGLSTPCVPAYARRDQPVPRRVVAAWLPRPAANRLAQQGPLDGPVVGGSSDTGRECVAAMPKPRASTRAIPCPPAQNRGGHAPSRT